MFITNERYKVNQKIPMKDFIPKELKPADRKKIKDCVKSCTLTDQLVGEEIPSVVNADYNYQVIQCCDFQLTDIKKAIFIANLYQGIIKSPCVLRLFDASQEVYSFALKRLNQNDATQVVVTDTLNTDAFSTVLPSMAKAELAQYIALENLTNKHNKVTLYLELYVKAYLLSKDKVYAGAKALLERKDIWYSESKVREIYTNMRALELLKLNLTKTNGNAEKMGINKEIKISIRRLEEY